MQNRIITARGARALAVTAAALVAGSAVAVPAQAADVRPTSGEVVSFEQAYTVTSQGDQYGDLSQYATYNTGLFHVDSDLDGIVDEFAYCIEMFISIDTDGSVGVDFLNDSQVKDGGNAFFVDADVDGVPVRDRVHDVIDTGFPNASLEALAAEAGVPGLTREEAITATQAAIWSYTEAVNVGGSYQERTYTDLWEIQGDQQWSLNGSESDQRVGQLMRYLQDGSDDAAALPRVDLEAGADVAYGNAGPITVDTNQADVKVESNYELVDAQGNPVDPAHVADGTELFTKIPAGATEDWTVRAESYAVSHANQVAVARTGGREQTLMLTGNSGPAWSTAGIPLLDVQVTTQATPDDITLTEGGTVDVQDTAFVEGTIPTDGWTLGFELFLAEEGSGGPVCDDPVASTETVPAPAGQHSGTEVLSPEVSLDKDGTYYWVETLRDAEGEAVHVGECGLPNETVVVHPGETTTENPEEPSTETPEEPSTETPEEPSTETPEEPSTEAPEEPSGETPNEPTTENPEKPSGETPNEPTTTKVVVNEGETPAKRTTTPRSSATATAPQHVGAMQRVGATQQQAARSQAAPARGALARTGDEVGMLAAAGLGLTVVGGTLVGLRKRLAAR